MSKKSSTVALKIKEKYCNNEGAYEVLFIDGDLITIRWIDRKKFATRVVLRQQLLGSKKFKPQPWWLKRQQPESGKKSRSKYTRRGLLILEEAWQRKTEHMKNGTAFEVQGGIPGLGKRR